MILLDTNVLSELIRPVPARSVVAWVNSRPTGSLYTTSVTQAEILHGVLLLPQGKRRAQLLGTVEAMFRDDFSGRILGFGPDAALPYARIASERRRAGKPITHFDAQIAAIARSCGATVATRNVADFVGCGVTVVDPWAA